jgi:hypothetical protein
MRTKKIPQFSLTLKRIFSVATTLTKQNLGTILKTILGVGDLVFLVLLFTFLFGSTNPPEKVISQPPWRIQVTPVLASPKQGDPTADWKTYTSPPVVPLTSEQITKYSIKYPTDWYVNEPGSWRPHPSNVRFTTYKVSPAGEPFDRNSTYCEISIAVWGRNPIGVPLKDNPEIQNLQAKGYKIEELIVSGIRGMKATTLQVGSFTGICEAVYLPVGEDIFRIACFSSASNQKEYLQTFRLMLSTFRFGD